MLHFRISGDVITAQARELVLEEAWPDGLKLLMDGLEGMTYEVAITILTGQKQLVGVNTVELADEEPEVARELTERLNWLFAGTVRTRGQKLLHWRPYAQVTNWDKEDLPHRDPGNRWHRSGYNGMPSTTDGRHVAWALARNVAYMDDVREDRAIRIGCQTVLWAQVTQPPPWLTCTRSWADGCASYVQHRGELPVRGAHLRQREEPRPVVAALVPPVPAVSITEDVLPPAVDDKDWESPPIPGSLHEQQGYINCDGQFYPCRYMEHDALACRILKHLYQRPDETNPGHAVEQLGLIKATVSQLDYRPHLYYHGNGKPTAAQRQIAMDWCELHGLLPSEVDFFQ